MAHVTALKPIFMGQIRTAEVHAWTAIAQLAQKRLMESALLVLVDLFLLPEAFANHVELGSFPAGEAPTVQVVLQDAFQGHGAVQLVNRVQPEATKVRNCSATHAREAKFRSQAVQLAAHVLPGVSPKMVWCVKHVRTEPFLSTEAASVTAVPLGPILTEAATVVPNALQEQSHRFLAAPNVGDVQQAPSLLQEVVSVAAVVLENILGQEAAAVPNVRQEKSHRLQAAVSAELALPERMKSTGKSATCAHKVKFLQWRAVRLADHVMLAVLRKRP